MNSAKTYILIAAMTALFMAIGGLIGGIRRAYRPRFCGRDEPLCLVEIGQNGPRHARRAKR